MSCQLQWGKQAFALDCIKSQISNETLIIAANNIIKTKTLTLIFLVNCPQAHISQLEHCHAQRLLEVTARHHQELDLEMDRLRDSQLQAEQALETREKAHRQRVKCLEEQVS